MEDIEGRSAFFHLRTAPLLSVCTLAPTPVASVKEKCDSRSPMGVPSVVNSGWSSRRDMTAGGVGEKRRLGGILHDDKVSAREQSQHRLLRVSGRVRARAGRDIGRELEEEALLTCMSEFGTANTAGKVEVERLLEWRQWHKRLVSVSDAPCQ